MKLGVSSLNKLFLGGSSMRSRVHQSCSFGGRRIDCHTFSKALSAMDWREHQSGVMVSD